MHYYQQSIGDYRRDTGHLSYVEHGIYRALLDTYYLSEEPLCADHAKLMRSHSIRSADEQQALENVLTDFFTLTEDGYRHKRCDVEIQKFHAKSQKARQSASARWEKKPKESTGDANAMRTHSEGNANHKPITNNHKPITNSCELVHTQPENQISEPPTPRKQKSKLDSEKSKLDFSGWPNQPSAQVWADYKTLRARRRAPITQTVVNHMAKVLTECDRMGYSVDRVLSLAIQCGWQGLETDWVLNKLNSGGGYAANQNGFRKTGVGGGLAHDDTSWADGIFGPDTGDRPDQQGFPVIEGNFSRVVGGN